APSQALGLSQHTGAGSAENDSGLACQLIVKMGVDRFVDVYEKKYPSDKSLVTRKAYLIYTDCKNRDNLVKESSLSQAVREEMISLARTLADIAGAALSMQRAIAGGGTMYLDLAAEAAASRADAYGRIVGIIMKSPGPNTIARAKAVDAMKRAVAITAKLEAHRNGFDTKFQWSQYNRGLDLWKTSTAQMSKLIARITDCAAGAVADKI